MIKAIVEKIIPKLLDTYAIYDKREADERREEYLKLLDAVDEAEDARSPHHSMDDRIEAEQALERFSLAFGDKYDKALEYLKDREAHR